MTAPESEGVKVTAEDVIDGVSESYPGIHQCTLTVRAEKTYSSVERSGDHPVETILEKLSSPGVAKNPCPRFKEWTSDGKGLEFTLARVMPPVPSNIAFGPFNFEREPVQMVRCITADLLGDKYGIHVDPGGVYTPAPY